MRKLVAILLVLNVLLLITIHTSAQYSIDLKNIRNEPLNYMKLGSSGPKENKIRVNNVYMEKASKPILPVMGEFHYVRLDKRYWRDALLKMKSSGVNIVSTYILWSLHEEIEGEDIWTGNRNLREFVKLCGELDLLVHIRIGPYCNAEIIYGGLPEWIVTNPLFQSRSNDVLYLNHVRKWYEKVFAQVDGLFYKDNGPIMGVQIENEFIKKGIVISHLMNLKKMAVQIGFDAPLYSMTHWMDSEYPKGEIIPYAGFYIETPWITDNGKMTAATNFEYFTYNRLSDNIGNDIIKIEGDVEFFDGSKSDSPFFTCEIGVGAPTFYRRRAVVPAGMAGENINLRLGTGVNLMGYYMYVGGTNPRGVKNTFGDGPFFGYDYQAPIREFGTLGTVMKETKKLNYFMNAFGDKLAPMMAYLPLTNKDKENLQWSVRTDGKAGYLFVSNHLYRYDRKNYDNVQFEIKLKDENLIIPRKPVRIVNKSYFLWPFNLNIDGVNLKYATAQPITSHKKGAVTSFFFFQDDQINAEYLIDENSVKEVYAQGAQVVREKGYFFVKDVIPDRESMITIVKTDGEKINLVTISKDDSDNIWKGQVDKKDFVAISKSSLQIDNSEVFITDENNHQKIAIYDNDYGKAFQEQLYNNLPKRESKVNWKVLRPMDNASWIRAVKGQIIERSFDLGISAEAAEVTLRFATDRDVKVFVNNQQVQAHPLEEYFKVDIKPEILVGVNHVRFEGLKSSPSILAEIEVLYKNGVRKTWNTDNTWMSVDQSPVELLQYNTYPKRYAKEERIGLYKIEKPDLLFQSDDELRLELDLLGDVVTAYIGSEPITDRYNDGTTWLLGLTRHREALLENDLTIKIKGFNPDSDNIFLEKGVDRIKAQQPNIEKVKVVVDYSYKIDF